MVGVQRSTTVHLSNKTKIKVFHSLNTEIGIKSNFSFKILKPCDSKWELAYEEAKLQFKLDVLISNNYYNGIINCRIGKKPKNARLNKDR